MTKRIVIRRDRTFEYMGERYRVLGAHASTGNSYELTDMAFNSVGDYDFNSMAELRAWLNEGIEKGWPLGTPMTQSEWAMLNNPPAALPGTDEDRIAE